MNLCIFGTFQGYELVCRLWHPRKMMKVFPACLSLLCKWIRWLVFLNMGLGKGMVVNGVGLWGIGLNKPIHNQAVAEKVNEIIVS